MRFVVSLLALLAFVAPNRAGELTPAERGQQALLSRPFTPAPWALTAHDNLWKQWGISERPKDYARAVQERYGLPPAPYENGALPMGLRQGQLLFAKGLLADCMLCHGGSLLGKSHVGLGNAS